jgi:hypothetical protein
MWRAFGSAVDVVHALLMVAWVIGLPLLFVRRWQRLTHAYSVYAIAFILTSQLSHVALGECFLTTISRALWEHSAAYGAALTDSSEWFTVRLAKWVFDMSPTHRAVVISTELLILLTVLGELFVLHRKSARVFAAKRAEQLRTHMPKG